MGQIADRYAVVYRDYVTQGVPASGGNEPQKSDIRATGTMIEAAISQLAAAFVADAATVIYAAKSSLLANLAPADRSIGIVYNDTPANNGIYIKSGATGSGTWNATGLMLQGDKGDVATIGIGTVTSGVSPAVTNSGTSSAAILNFVLPRGKSFLETAIDTGYVPAGTTETQLTTKIVGQITAAAVAARDAALAASALATQQANAAGASASLASAAKQAVLDNIAGIDVQAGLTLQAVSVDALRAVTVRPEGRQAYLSQGNRAGAFAWSSADLSAKVAIDIGMGIYIPPAGQNGSQGAWVRVTNPGDVWMVSWFFDTLSDTRSGKIVQSIDLLAPAGVTIRFPATAPLAFKLAPWVTPGRGFTVGIICSKTRIWEGCGRGTIIEPVPTSDGEAHYKLFYTGASGITFRDMMFRNFRNSDSAGPPNPIQIRTPLETEIESGFVQAQDIYDTTVERVAWEDCDTGVREMYAFAPVNGTIEWFQTYRTKIIDCTFVRQGYTAIVVDGNGAQIIRPDIDMIPGITRPFSFGIRVVGATDAIIVDPKIATGVNDNAIGFMGAGVGSTSTTGGYRYSRGITVRNPYIKNGRFFYGDIGHRVLIENMNCWRDPTLTDSFPLVTSGSGIFPHDFGSFEIRGGFAVGYNIGVDASPQNIHSITIKDFTLVGNAAKNNVGAAMLYKGLVQGLDHAGNAKKSPRFLTLERVNYIVDPSLVGFPITFTGEHSDMCITIRGCMFPEYIGGPSYALMVGSNPWVNADGKGFVKLATLTGIATVLGDNGRFPAGFYNRYAEDINRAEFVVGPYPATWT